MYNPFGSTTLSDEEIAAMVDEFVQQNDGMVAAVRDSHPLSATSRSMSPTLFMIFGVLIGKHDLTADCAQAATARLMAAMKK